MGAALIALGSCSGSAGDGNQPANTVNVAVPTNTTATDAVDAKVVVPAVDPKSPAAARAVVDDYAALAEKGSLGEAAKYWTNAPAAAQFATTLEDYPKVAMISGKPTDPEGAMGSIFITVPVTLDLTLRSGSPYQMTCKATLRRVNDVPGSTQEQRRWRIETIDC